MSRNLKKIFYGCARKHRIIYSDALVITNDIDKFYGCNITCDIRSLISGDFLPGLLDAFDAFIFTPPCNYYSRANYRRDSSEVALSTKDLLPLCLKYCVNSGKPFIVENVLNKSLLGNLFPQYQFVCGGHTYWSNILYSEDFSPGCFVKQNKQYLSRNMRDNNYNVDLVLRTFVRRVCGDFLYV